MRRNSSPTSVWAPVLADRSSTIMPVVPTGRSASGLASRPSATTSAATRRPTSAAPSTNRNAVARRTGRRSAPSSPWGSRGSRRRGSRRATIASSGKGGSRLGSQLVRPLPARRLLRPRKGARRLGQRPCALPLQHVGERFERLAALVLAVGPPARPLDQYERALER